MVQQTSLRPQRGSQDPEVGLEIRRTDMLGHAYGTDRVERLPAQIPVVLQADLDSLAQSRRCHPLPRECGLLTADRDTDDLDAMSGGCVHRHGPPATTDVEHSHAWLQSEFGADQLTLGQLRRREVGAAIREVRTGCRRCPSSIA